MTSTPNPTHIIAEHHAEHGEAGSQQIPGCYCGWQGEALEHPPWNPIPGVADALHAAHVVSKLTDAGYSDYDYLSPEVDLCPSCGTDRLRAMCWCGVQSVEYPDAIRVVADALQNSLGWDWPETPEERIPSGREICADVAADVLASILASGLVLIPGSERARTESVDRVVNDFIHKRREFVQAAKASRGSDADYWRWQGHMESRRQIAQSLGKAYE